LTPFSLFTGAALVVGYALLGATWLILKAEDHVQRRAFAIAFWVTPVMLAMIGVVSLWTPCLDPIYAARWFGWPHVLLAIPVPLLVLASGFILMKGLIERRELSPFLAAQSLFVLSFVGIGISFYPNIVPHSVTIWEAAAADNSLSFLLVGAAALIPLILAYTAYSYWVFRGKVKAVGGYH
jgi:cytochrome d ubiquinol oxidase subunit II